jgi:hypothetical protein
MNVIEGEVLDARKYKKKSNISKHMVDMFWMVHKLAEKEDWKDSKPKCLFTGSKRGLQPSKECQG